MSWTEILMEYNKNELKKEEFERLNFKFELHFCKYIVNILKDKFQFKYQNNELQIYYENQCISKEAFIYWWQITRFDEITKDQSEIKSKINDINKKLNKIAKLYPKISETDNEETKQKKNKTKEELDKKKDKIIEFIKKDEPSVKLKMTLLNNFKLLCPTIESLNNLLETMNIYIHYNDLKTKEEN